MQNNPHQPPRGPAADAEQLARAPAPQPPRWVRNPAPPLRTHPVVRALETEFGRGMPDGEALFWQLPDAAAPEHVVILRVAAIGLDNWLGLTVQFSAARGLAAMRITLADIGAPYFTMVRLVRQHTRAGSPGAN